MHPLLLIGLVGAGGVLLLDTLAAVASRFYGFPFTRLAIGSFVIYAIVGAVAGRHADLPLASAVTALVGVVEATGGWAITWAIGPGRLPQDEVTTRGLVRVALQITVSAAVIGAAAASIARAW